MSCFCPPTWWQWCHMKMLYRNLGIFCYCPLTWRQWRHMKMFCSENVKIHVLHCTWCRGLSHLAGSQDLGCRRQPLLGLVPPWKPLCWGHWLISKQRQMTYTVNARISAQLQISAPLRISAPPRLKLLNKRPPSNKCPPTPPPKKEQITEYTVYGIRYTVCIFLMNIA